MSPTHRTAPPLDHATLAEIAEVLDLVAACRAGLDDASDETAVRAALFELLDQPTQETWEKVRETEIVPGYVPGLTTPSPLGLTLADVVYLHGIPDMECPPRSTLLRELRRVAEENGVPTQG